MTIPIFHVDSFTDKPFGGNPAAVCILEKMSDESWMQSIAGEMNLSETAFVAPAADGYDLRWFTPRAEVALCGHATLASAHVLWEAGYLPAWEVARFQTKSGLLTCEREGGLIRMDFPATLAKPALAPKDLIASLGNPKVEFAGRTKFDYLLALPSEAAVRALTPEFARMTSIPDVRGVIVTAPSQEKEFDFVSRFFAPAVGVAEDPVTGSAHCALTPYWAERLGKTEMAARQVSERGGRLNVRLVGDRVQLAGQAVTVLRGSLI